MRGDSLRYNPAIPSTPPQITELLLAWGEGDQSALEQLIPVVHAELRRLATREMRRERPGHTLQATGLVNEAFMRLVELKRIRWQNRAHFFAISARLMRRVLVDFARSKHSHKRGDGLRHVSLDEALTVTQERGADGEVDHLFPSVLPGGQAVLFTITGNSGIDNAQVAVLDLKTGQRKTLVHGGGQAEYVGSSTSPRQGYLIYAAAGELRAMRFDPVRLEVLSDPVTIVEHVWTKPSGAAEFSVSHGALAYLPGGVNGALAMQRSLVWVNRQGREEPIKAPLRAYSMARLSPDGTRIALEIRDQDNDIWTWDLAHETLTRITKDPASDVFPVWTRDGRRILFASARNGVQNVYWQSADGSGTAERLATSPNVQRPLSVSPAGTEVVVQGFTGSLTSSLLLLHLDSPSTVLGAGGPSERRGPARLPWIEPLVQTTFSESNGIISPDGHWLAYESNESGRYEIYVRPFPHVNGGLRQVSSRGGDGPLWAPNGRELFYLDNGFLTTVPVQPPMTTTFNFGSPTKLFDTPYYADGGRYDVSRDGQKFLMLKQVPAANQPVTPPPAPTMIVVLNWVEEVQARRLRLWPQSFFADHTEPPFATRMESGTLPPSWASWRRTPTAKIRSV